MMQRFLLTLILVYTLFMVTGCQDSGNVKVYDDEDISVEVTHQEMSMTAVVAGIDRDNNLIDFVECITGNRITLIYHGGVAIVNSFGNTIDINDLSCGEIMDVVYYSDTDKLVSMTVSGNAIKRMGVCKFTINMEKLTASYKGTTVNVADFITAYDDGKSINPMEISTEDQVTLYLYGDKLVSIVVELGHGYVRLINHDTYVGGMVELGYDVIVPVTSDMLMDVREGTYTLRISKNGYSDSKENVTVKKGEMTEVDLIAIAIPRGTVTFDITPADATLYVNGYAQDGHAYSNIYGSYEIKIKADGYNTYRRSIKISDTLKSYKVELTKTDGEDDEDTDTTETTTSETATTETTTESGASATTENVSTNNKITIATPIDVGVYVDGEYVGMSPVTFDKTVGTHTITLYKAGYLIKSYTIQSLDDGNDDTYSLADLVPLSTSVTEPE